MIETQARVLSTELALVWEEPRPRSPCGRCDPVAGYRSLSFARIPHPGEPPFHVHNPLDGQVGDGVVESLLEPGVLKGALMSLAPLAGVCLGAALGAAVSKLLSYRWRPECSAFAITWLAVRRSVLFRPDIIARYISEPFTLEKTCRSKN